jgi:two-component system, OmpR family, response regulator ChvI
VKNCGSYIKKSRVLLVDDEPDILYLVKTRLERNGFEVDAYTDPLLALQNFKSDLYFLLVLDIKMPKMDGIELFNRIEKEDSNLKVCFFSASENLISYYKNLFQNSTDKFLFVLKPLSIPEMTKQIKHFLSNS